MANGVLWESKTQPGAHIPFLHFQKIPCRVKPVVEADVIPWRKGSVLSERPTGWSPITCTNHEDWIGCQKYLVHNIKRNVIPHSWLAALQRDINHLKLIKSLRECLYDNEFYVYLSYHSQPWGNIWAWLTSWWLIPYCERDISWKKTISQSQFTMASLRALHSSLSRTSCRRQWLLSSSVHSLLQLHLELHSQQNIMPAVSEGRASSAFLTSICNC